MSALGWTPKTGEIVHLNPRNRWQLPAGRYRLDRGQSGYWHLVALALLSDHLKETKGVPVAHLIAAEVAGTLTVIDPEQIERDRQVMAMQSLAPMRSPRRQHDTSDLALFKAANEPGLL